MQAQLAKGNITLARAALAAGCRGYFGYPITPQSEILEYLRQAMPDDGVCLQAESEVASINMVLGAAACGIRVMTSSSGPGIPLMQEGISALASAELPAVIVNVMRNGSGGGSIQPGQGDYHAAVKGGGNGDYRTLVLSPASVQEMWDLTGHAFNLADKYRNPVMILADGAIGQLTEAVVETPTPILAVEKEWKLRGRGTGKKRDVITWHWTQEESERFQFHLRDKYARAAEEDTLLEELQLDDAEVVCVAFGIVSRIVREAVERVRKEGVRAGLLRPITLFPFPERRLAQLAHDRKVLVVEQNNGQMLEDVQRHFRGPLENIHFHGRGGGNLPTATDVANLIRDIVDGKQPRRHSA